MRRRFSPLNPGKSLPYDRQLASEASSARWRPPVCETGTAHAITQVSSFGDLGTGRPRIPFMPARPLERAASCFAKRRTNEALSQNRRSCSKPPRRSINRTPTPIRRTGRARREGGRQQVGIVVQLQAGASLFQGGLGEVMKLEFHEWLARAITAVQPGHAGRQLLQQFRKPLEAGRQIRQIAIVGLFDAHRLAPAFHLHGTLVDSPGQPPKPLAKGTELPNERQPPHSRRSLQVRMPRRPSFSAVTRPTRANA